MDVPTSSSSAPQDIALPAPPFQADERLLTLFHFWLTRGWHQDAPDRAQVPLDLLQPWIGHISVFHAVDDGADFQLRLDGTEIVAITGEDWTRRRASDIDRRYGSDLAGQLSLAIRTGRPLVHGVRVLQHRYLRGTRLMLPVRSVPMCAPDQVFLVLYLDRTEPVTLRR
jgi:hypothetical protein